MTRCCPDAQARTVQGACLHRIRESHERTPLRLRTSRTKLA